MSRTTPLAFTFVAGLAATALLVGCGQADKADTAPAPAATESVAVVPAAPVEQTVQDSPPPAAATPPGAQRVQFQAGGVGASLAGSVKGYDTPTYVVGARAGQQMVVKIAGSPNASFNIFAPGDRPGEAEAMFIGATAGERFSGVLPESGDYTIQVGQPRAQARRDETADFQLDVQVTDAGQ